MYDVKLRYLASVFVDADSIRPSAEVASGLSAALGDPRFTPSTVYEGIPPSSRLAFIAEDAGWSLLLRGTRFDISLAAKDPNGTNLGDFAQFCSDASAKLSAALQYFDRKAHRIAAVQEGLLREMTETELDTIAGALLKLPPTYQSHRPFEWDWRVAAKIDRTFGGVTDPTFTLTTIKRLAGQLRTLQPASELEFDRVRVDLDVNTTAHNPAARFGLREVQAFLAEAPSWHRSLQEEVSDFLKLEAIVDA